MSKIKYLVFVAVLLLCFPVSAEYYKYYGPDGKERYTDDINKVPKIQRAKAKGFAGYETDAGNSMPEVKNETEPAGDVKDLQEGGKSESAKSADFDKTREALEKKKIELENEFNALAKEREGLDRIKGEVKTTEQMLQYNSTIQDHNEKIKIYSTKRKSFVSEADGYNSEVEKVMKSELEKYNRDKKAEAESEARQKTQ